MATKNPEKKTESFDNGSSPTSGDPWAIQRSYLALRYIKRANVLISSMIASGWVLSRISSTTED
jgi:hypothetical protein